LFDLAVTAPRPSWYRSGRFVPRTVVQPVLRFIQLEVASGIVLLAAATLALIWSNSRWHAAYETLWNTPLVLRLGTTDLLDGLALRAFVNEALLALFFLLAGLEIKRQIVVGELREWRKAALPVVGAAGGMIVPALIYLALNAGRPGAHGWGATVATDVAFAVGVVALAGRRVPVSARIFILTVAVADDIGGIIVIAVFYSTGIRGWWLLAAVLPVAVAILLERVDVRSHVPYVALAVVCWLACRKAGIEAAIVGVVFGLLTPIRPFHNPAAFGAHSRALITRIEQGRNDDEMSEVSVQELATFAVENASPLERLENRLAPWITLMVMPLLAFANAGVRFAGSNLDGRVVAGIVVGRVVGKVIGIAGAVWLTSRLMRTSLPSGMNGRHLLGVAASGGIGFTVALFITTVAFPDGALAGSAKVGVLLAAAVAGLMAFTVLRLPPADPVPEAPLITQPDQHSHGDS
jgi:Na+:H+ antiporter, NhaA family